uniref:Uncharacterized protein n=1 Tax=viral metagenome TaxID=1070528 RepID=A0A6M3KP73_9ZZZZ
MIKKIEEKPDPEAFGKPTNLLKFFGDWKPSYNFKVKIHNRKQYGNSDKKN